MKLLDFDYLLPDERIARYPLENRSDAKMLVINRAENRLSDDIFKNFPQFLDRGDVMVLNETKVIPARLRAVREDTGAVVEIFLVHRHPERTDVWDILAAPAKKVKVGESYRFSDRLECDVIAEADAGMRTVRFSLRDHLLQQEIDRIGAMPIPPYLHRDAESIDKERYQTIFARTEGAVAAPTASLHFTDAVLDECTDRGVRIAKITLHVGLGTFRPVESEDITQHTMHSEEYEVSTDAAQVINSSRAGGGRIIAVGTTAARTLETVADDNGIIHPKRGKTAIFIYPPYQFKAVDVLLTNFHQPRSTLLMMISAFAGYDLVMNAYRHALSSDYRFLSYGDAMLIL